MKNTRVFILAALPVLAFFYACKKTGTPEETGRAVTATVRTETAAAPGQAPKEPAKKAKQPYARKETYFALPNHAGGQIDLANYGGKPVMLKFFTETCPYCRKAAPFMQKAYQSYKGRGLNVIGISLNNDPSSTADFVREFGLTFPVACQGARVSRQYKVQGVPYIFLLKKDHTLYNVWAGYDESFDGEIISGIEEILK